MVYILKNPPQPSTAVSAMITVLKKCFPTEFVSEELQRQIKILISTFGKTLNENPALLNQIRLKISQILKL
jgi:malate dehydrogenase (quinone)